MVVYALYFPNGKQYVGLTSQPIEKRIYAHKYAAFKLGLTNKLYNALRKYKDEKIYYAVIYEGDSMSEIKQVEKDFITVYDSYHNGYNETLGGEGARGFRQKESTLKLLSQIRKLDAPTRLINANATLKELRKTSEYRDKISQAKGGKKFTVHDEQGNFIGEWVNQTVCAEFLNLKPNYICKALKTGKTYLGYKFKLKD